MEAPEIRDILQSSEFLSGLTPQQIDSILPVCRIIRCEAGESIYAQGGSGDSLYIIADGQVALERALSLGTRKGTVAVAILGKGKLFGGWSTLLGENHRLMLSAVCQKPTHLVVLKGDALRVLMTQDIRLGFAILEKLCFLLRERILHSLGAMENI
jgi:CRP-like cAMP-binding protein